MLRPQRLTGIVDPPSSGVANMARDEALLRLQPESPPTLRFYQWAQPTLSLGYFQRLEDVQALPAALRGLPVVRRLTGGGAIRHDRELTYSLVLPRDHRFLADGPTALYALMHDVLIDALAVFGITACQRGAEPRASARAMPERGQDEPFLCFARRSPFDVLVGERKVIGSAQRRARHALLQHGSIVLQACPAGAAPLDAQRLTRAVVDAASARMGVDPEPRAWTSRELSLADTLAADYLHPRTRPGRGRKR